MKYLQGWFFLFSVLLCSCLYGQERSVITRLDSNSMMIGDQQVLRLGVNHKDKSESVKYDLSSLLDSDWEILKRSHLTHRKVDNGYETYKDFLITYWETGTHTIPSVNIIISDGNKTDTLRTDSIQLDIVSPQEAQNLNDLKDIYRMPFSWRKILYIAAGIIAGLIVIFFIVRYYMNREKEEEVIVEEKPAPPPDPPHEIAIQRLDKLSNKHLIERDKVDQFQSELTHIIRQFLGTTYDFPALEMTTEEILQTMREKQAYVDNLDELSRFLRQADLVKFAKAQPEEIFHRSMLQFGYETVEQLKPDSISYHRKKYSEFKEEEE